MGEKLKFRCIDRPDTAGNYLYAVRFPEEIKTVRSLVNAILGQKTWGFITIRTAGGDVNVKYRGTKLLDRLDQNTLNKVIPAGIIGATGQGSRMDYLIEVEL